MRISDWSSDVCSSDLASREHSWAWTGDIRRASLSWIVRSCPANFFFLACRKERIAGRTERRPTMSGLSAVMSGAQFPKIEPVPGYDDRFLMRVKGFCSAPAFGADARFPDAAKGRMQVAHHRRVAPDRSEEQPYELQSLMRISYADFC